jgi:hypothetical protein
MKIIQVLASAGLAVSIATAVAAQTAAPAPATNPNTKVYGYQNTAPAKSKILAEIKQRKADETPPHGSTKWWELQDRKSLGGGSDGGGL